MRNSGSLYKHNLETLHAAFKHDEESRVKRLIDERNAYANVVGYHQNIPASQYSASTALVAAVTEAPELDTQQSLLSSDSPTTFLSLNKMMSDLCSSGWLNNITDEEEENENDDLVCMFAKMFNRFKSRSKRFRHQYKGPSNVNKSKMECFKCGKKVHFMKECPQARFMTPQYQSRSSFGGSSSGQHSYQPKSEGSYHQKYKA